MNQRVDMGKQGETDAVNLLKKKGYRILERNYRTKAGEVDIIARHRGTIVFVEVKARGNHHYGNPKYAITPRKKRNLSMAALSYLKKTGQSNAKARFDVVAIVHTGGAQSVEVIQNAFELAYP